MLSPDERQAARQSAERCSSLLKDGERDQTLQMAYDMIDVLKERFGDDDTSCRVAQLFVRFLAVMAATPAIYIGDVLDGSSAAYAFAAGSLAGVYELPERKAPDPNPDIPEHETTGDPTSPSDATGMYL